MAKGMRAVLGVVGLITVLWSGGCSPPEPADDDAAPTKAAGALQPLSHGSADEIRALARRVTSYQITTPYHEGEYTLAHIDEGKPVTALFMLADGKYIKSKWPSRSGGWRLCDATTKTIYDYLPERGYITRMKLTSKIQSTRLRDIDRQLGQPAEITPDTVDGMACYKVYQKNEMTEAGFTLWFDCTYGLPRQTADMGKAEKLAYDRINAIPPSEFEPPAGMAIYDWDALPPPGATRPGPLPPAATPTPSPPPPPNQPAQGQPGPATLPPPPRQQSTGGGQQPMPSPDEANQPNGAATGMRR